MGYQNVGILGVKERAEEVRSQQGGLEAGQLYENVTVGSARSAHRKIQPLELILRSLVDL